MTSQGLMTFVHVALFAYWLGADLGVHLAALWAIVAAAAYFGVAKPI